MIYEHVNVAIFMLFFSSFPYFLGFVLILTLFLFHLFCRTMAVCGHVIYMLWIYCLLTHCGFLSLIVLVGPLLVHACYAHES